MLHWKSRVKAAAIHLGLSCVVAACAALLVFGLWYPAPYDTVAGGRGLFILVVTVDVILGPLITLAVFNPTKPRRTMMLDFAVVGLIQLAGLGYGLWTVSAARPVHLVFEVDRFRVIHALEVPQDQIAQTPPDVRALPLLGPTIVAVRPFKDGMERFEMASAELKGEMISAMPRLWQPYDQARARVLAAAKPVEVLKRQYPGREAEIDRGIAATGRAPQDLRTLPMVARKAYWSVLLDAQTAEVVGYLPLDSF